MANNNHQESILETQEPILITSRKRGRPKKVKIPIDEIIITTKKKSITDTNNISSTRKTSGKYELRIEKNKSTIKHLETSM